MPAFLISSTEPALLRALGSSSTAPEKYGADVMWAERTIGGLVCVQRKEFHDLLKSAENGMLQRELAKITKAKLAVLVVEGRPHWTTEGRLNDQWLGHWTREGYRSLLRSVQYKGILVEYTEDTADTVSWVESLAKWVAKGEHRSLDRHPKAGPDKWGKRTTRAVHSQILQAIDGVGVGQADAILDTFDGIPLAWTVGEKELLAVKGVGPKTLRAMLRVIAAPVV